MFVGDFVKQIIALTEALEELPVIRKLDLRGNEAMGVEVRSAMWSKSRCYSLDDTQNRCTTVREIELANFDANRQTSFGN